VRSRADSLGIEPKLLAESDFHVHVPAGAIPKDGPSAGTAMFTAIASLLMNRPVRSDVAMTGEITLRGLVLPIGGLKEKTLAAKRAGIKQVIVPKRNEKDLPDIPEEVRNTLKFHFVNNIDEVLAVALGAAAKASAKAAAKPAAKDTPAGGRQGHGRGNGDKTRPAGSKDGKVEPEAPGRVVIPPAVRTPARSATRSSAPRAAR
jgi:hypothetical protein